MQVGPAEQVDLTNEGHEVVPVGRVGLMATEGHQVAPVEQVGLMTVEGQVVPDE